MVVLAGRPVVAGVDGSAAAWQALAWAAREAEHEHRALRVVHAWEVPLPGYAPVPEAVDAMHDAGELLLREATTKASEWAPSLVVTGRLSHGPAARVLVDEGRDAAMVVIGSHGRGGFARLLLGSVSDAVAMHAGVPVVVVRGKATDAAWRPGTVVVGVDGSEISDDAVDAAFLAASRRAGELVVVHAWRRPDPLVDEAYAVLAEPSARETESRLAIAESIAGLREKYPDVRVTQQVAGTHPVQALVDAARERDAALLVVGSRGRGGFAGLLLGSVSRGVLHHATCPVMVVRPVHDR